jgi:hypothetical protein
VNINFSAALTTIQSDLDTLFPGMPEEQAVKNLLFGKLRDSQNLPVRYLTYMKSGDDVTMLLDVPHVSNVSEIASDVTPFSSTAA